MSAGTEFEKNVEVMVAVPKMYAVIMHNDDYTPMDFVVYVLSKIFHKSNDDAEATMLDVHRKGMGVAGIYPFDIAVTKKMQADQLAEEKGHPLRLSLAEELGGTL